MSRKNGKMSTGVSSKRGNVNNVIRSEFDVSLADSKYSPSANDSSTRTFVNKVNVIVNDRLYPEGDRDGSKHHFNTSTSDIRAPGTIYHRDDKEAQSYESKQSEYLEDGKERMLLTMSVICLVAALFYTINDY